MVMTFLGLSLAADHGVVKVRVQIKYHMIDRDGRVAQSG